MGRMGRWRAKWSALSRPRRLAAIAAVTVAAGLMGAVAESRPDDGIPAPVVWRDHVLDPTTTSTP